MEDEEKKTEPTPMPMLPPLPHYLYPKSEKSVVAVATFRKGQAWGMAACLSRGN